MRKLRLYSATAASLFLLAACKAPTTARPMVSQEELWQEQAAQEAMSNQVKAQGGQPQHWQNLKGSRKRFETAAARIEKSGAQMCRILGVEQKSGCYFFFDLDSRDESINAHADGKKIVVANGMMRFIASDEELAMVMAHEMSHNLLSHPEANQTNALAGGFVGLLADALVSSQGVNTQGEFTKMGAQAGVLSYSRDFESEADYVGMYILANAGYNIRNVANLWRRMSVQDSKGIYTGQTHPTNPERFIALNKTVTEIEYKRKHRMPLVPEFKPQT